jgi:bla regulator protein blaR1
VKENTSVRPATSDFPLDDGEGYRNIGGLFAATGYTLPFYMRFAFKLTDYQEGVILADLPEWARMKRFDIEARATGNPSKDEMRQMLITLLEDRFGLVFHHEMREAPVFWLELVTPGKTGRSLHALAVAIPCSDTVAGPAEPHEVQDPKTVGQPPWPTNCGILDSKATKTGLARVGARDVTLQWIANELTGATGFDSQMIDHTELSGTYDFSIEFTPQYNRPLLPRSPQFDENGPSFIQALKDQLGLKLKPHKELEDTIVIDHFEYPSPN